ncbi:hypothetical protein [Azospirillum aestuarii]
MDPHVCRSRHPHGSQDARQAQATEVAIGVEILDRVLDLGRLNAAHST